jgi:hypothetical protein
MSIEKIEIIENMVLKTFLEVYGMILKMRKNLLEKINDIFIMII